MAFSALQTAEALRKAMKGFGTDDAALIAAVTSCTNAQLQEVRVAFEKELQRDLIADIKSECSGSSEAALVGLIRTAAEFDASQLRHAIKGAGTDEDVFVQTLCHRTSAEVKAIEAAYSQMYSSELAADIKGDFGGDGQTFALGLIQYERKDKPIDQAAVDAQVDTLYSAGEGKWGTDEATMIELMCSAGPTWLKAVNETYGRKHGHTLVAAIEKEFSSFAAKGLAALIKPHDDYYADLLWDACEGTGTDEATLLRVIVGRRQHLVGINNAFMAKHNKTIADRLHSEVGGDFGKLVVAIAKAA